MGFFVCVSVSCASSFLILICLLYSPVCFLKRKRKQTWSRVWGCGEDPKGDEGGETVIKVHCLKIICFQ